MWQKKNEQEGFECIIVTVNSEVRAHPMWIHGGDTLMLEEAGEYVCMFVWRKRKERRRKNTEILKNGS